VDFFRSQKAEMVDGEAIQKIKDEYQHSAEERADLLVAFEQSQGDMDAVYEDMMCSNVLDDDQRFRKIIDDAISSKEVTGWTCYKKETAKQKLKRVKKAKREDIEAREYAEQLGVADKLFGDTKKDNKIDDASALAALIQQRQKGRADNSFENLEAKYGGGGKNSGKIKKRTIMDEPPEEAFEKNRKKKFRA
jgi:DnaJ homolog subfamily C member 9